MSGGQSIRFAVEYVFRGDRIGSVIARRLEPGDFRLHEDLRLGGRRVLSFTMPRAITPQGTPRMDAWVFTLENAGLEPLAVGDVVTMTGAED